MTAMPAIQASSSAAVALAAMIWTREESLMKWTRPCDRMKNSRSGKMARKRPMTPLAPVTFNFLIPLVVILCPEWGRPLAA